MAAMAITLASSAAKADLAICKEYTVSDAVLSVSTIKVKAHMIDAYLKGLKNTGSTSNEAARSLGQV
jgi:hypothetical protein